VNGAALDAFNPVTKLAVKTFGDLASRLVGEGEDADSRRIDLEPLDEVAHALDEAERFAGTGAGENQERLRSRLDRCALARGRRWPRCNRSGVGGDRRRFSA